MAAPPIPRSRPTAKIAADLHARDRALADVDPVVGPFRVDRLPGR
jgi:hypothetical protein